VDDDRLARYRQLCGFPDGTNLPPTYPHVLAWPVMFRLLRSRAFPLPIIGLVHIHNTIEARQELSTKDDLDFTVRWENLRDHDRGQAVDVVTEARLEGALVWRESSTYLRRRASGAPASQTAEPRAEVPDAEQTWRVEPLTARQYARISGDRNPIHTSTVVARLFGFPGRIAHGMWSLARGLAAAGLADQLATGQYTADASIKLPIVLPATVAYVTTPDGFDLRDARTGRPHLSTQLAAGPGQV